MLITTFYLIAAQYKPVSLEAKQFKEHLVQQMKESFGKH